MKKYGHKCRSKVKSEVEVRCEVNHHPFNLQNIKDATIEVYKKATKKNTEIIVDEQTFLGSDW